MNNAAHNLLNLTLASGWLVIEKIDKLPSQTGSFFSVPYKVQKDNQICFLKAFDFAKFFHVSQISGQNKGVVDVMSDMLNAYKYERDLSNLCRGKHVTKVAFVKEAGEESVSGHSIPLVPYLIFDLAEGDVRKHLSFSENLDLTWKLCSLHSIAVGLKQLHAIKVSHQDLKPSNVLLFSGESKIGDLGRSLSVDLKSPFGDTPFNGDWSYAPPELLYSQFEPDWEKRTFSTDCYLLGSMIVFYFTGVNMNALLRENLDDQFSWEYWQGSFPAIKDYLVESFQKAIHEFSLSLKNIYLKEELVKLVTYLCFPLPEKRGHAKNLKLNGDQYNLERFVGTLNLLHEKARYKLINN